MTMNTITTTLTSSIRTIKRYLVLMQELEQISQKLPYEYNAYKYIANDIDSNNTQLTIQFVKDDAVQASLEFRIPKNDDTYHSMYYELFKISFQNIDTSSNLQPYCLTYSVLQQSCKVQRNKTYELVKPFVFSEELYFQKLTQDDLPSEDMYKYCCEIFNSFWEGNYVYCYLHFNYLDMCLNAIEKSVLELRSIISAEHN